MKLRFSQSGGPTTTILLTPEQGAEIKALLEKNIDCRFTSYCHTIGMAYSNISAMLGGRKKISLKSLERLFSATTFTIECRTEFIIQSCLTTDAQDVNYPSLEDELFLEGRDESPTEQLKEKGNSSTTLVTSKKETKQDYSQVNFFQEESQ